MSTNDHTTEPVAAPASPAKEATREETPEMDRPADWAEICNSKEKLGYRVLRLHQERNAAERRAADASALVKHWQRRFDKVEAERDRLREALEHIRDYTKGIEVHSYFCPKDQAEIVETANEALAPSSETTTAES